VRGQLAARPWSATRRKLASSGAPIPAAAAKLGAPAHASRLIGLWL